MGAVGKTPNGFKFIRISSHTPKNIQEGSAEIICEDIDILSHPNETSLKLPQNIQEGTAKIICEDIYILSHRIDTC